VCTGANSVPCSYDYGWNAARQSFANAVAAEGTDGSANATLAARDAPWWLDVETGNAWETIEFGRTSATEAYDTAMLEGEVASFTNMGVTSLGIYSTTSQWGVITGGTSTAFSTIPVWVPGLASTLSAAQAACVTTSFTGARVAMIQYPSQGYDGDYFCGLLTAPISTSVSVGNSATFSNQLVTTNNSGAVSYVQTGGTPDLVVSPTGLVTTSGALTPGSYAATGTTSDPAGNTGTFTITLDIGVLLQSSPTSATLRALRTAGRFSVMSETAPSRSTRIVSYFTRRASGSCYALPRCPQGAR